MAAANQLHLWHDRFLYITPAIQSGLTARACATLLASATGRPFTLVTAGGTVLRCSAAVVAPHVPRRLDADDCGLLSLNIDPAAPGYRALAERLGAAAIMPLATRSMATLRESFEAAMHAQLADRPLQHLCTAMVQAACGEQPCAPEHVLDARIARVLARLQIPGEAPAALGELAAAVGLSPDRLTHLFHAQTGLSIKRYRLWVKIRRTIQLIGSGLPLTEAALAGGFTDAPHMSRSFQRHFGLPPSFLADSRRVDVRIDAQAARTWRAQTAGDAAGG